MTSLFTPPMPSPNSKATVVPPLVVAIGAGWLLTNLNVIPGVNWVWTGGLAILGLLALLVNGVDRFSIVVGPFFILASLASVLRQTGKIQPEIEIPALTIALGALWFAAVVLPVPPPKWMLREPATKK